jgi:glycosyltransferase involved in cell wall biosynthesis
MPKVSIVMPVYNQERIVAQSVRSAVEQDYEDKEVVVIDDCSLDRTYSICESFPVKLSRNISNIGLPANLDALFEKAQGEYIVILCGDDLFTHKSVVSDMVKVFEMFPKVGVIGRYYYQYMDGHPGAVMTIRGDILVSSCQPSGMGFRKTAIRGRFSKNILVEVPFMVSQILDAGWEYECIKYDTIAARLHPGPKGNAATNPDYYKTGYNQSPTYNWYKILGRPINMYMGFIQMKNSAPWMLWGEIKMAVKLNPWALANIGFWFCALVALIFPRWLLRPLSNFYRHRITRHFVHQITREEYFDNKSW